MFVSLPVLASSTEHVQRVPLSQYPGMSKISSGACTRVPEPCLLAVLLGSGERKLAESEIETLLLEIDVPEALNAPSLRLNLINRFFCPDLLNRT